jgi:hypothetical protein
MKSASGIISKFFTVRITGRVVISAVSHGDDYGFDSQRNKKHFFSTNYCTIQFYTFICNNQELSKCSCSRIYLTKYLYFSGINKI